MPRRSRSTRPKTYKGMRRPTKRARRAGGRQYMSSGSSYRTTVNAKCQATYVHQMKTDWNQGDDTTAARVKIHWDRFDVSTLPYTLGLNSSEEFKSWAGLFRSYKVNGLKIEYMPYKVLAAPTEYQARDSWVASFTDYGETTNQAVATGPTAIWKYKDASCQPDFKTWTHGKKWKKYINLNKFYRRRTENHVRRTIDATATTMATYIQDNVLGYANNNDVGRFNVTYYVTFSQPELVG